MKKIQADEMTLPDEMMEAYVNRLISTYDPDIKAFYKNNIKDIITDIYRTGRHHEIKSMRRLREKLFADSNS